MALATRVFQSHITQFRNFLTICNNLYCVFCLFVCLFVCVLWCNCTYILGEKTPHLTTAIVGTDNENKDQRSLTIKSENENKIGMKESDVISSNTSYSKTQPGAKLIMSPKINPKYETNKKKDKMRKKHGGGHSINSKYECNNNNNKDTKVSAKMISHLDAALFRNSVSIFVALVVSWTFYTMFALSTWNLSFDYSVTQTHFHFNFLQNYGTDPNQFGVKLWINATSAFGMRNLFFIFFL